MKKISIALLIGLMLAAMPLTACGFCHEGKGGTVGVTGTNNIPKIQAEFEKLENTILVIGPQGAEGSQIQMIAVVNEYGANIKITQKMAAWLAITAKEHGLPAKDGKGDGFINIPERSFMRATFDNEAALDKAFAQYEKAVYRILTGEGTAAQAANALGNALVAAVKNRIRSNIQPANSEFTRAIKGEGKNTLVDSGRLMQSISYEIKSA